MGRVLMGESAAKGGETPLCKSLIYIGETTGESGESAIAKLLKSLMAKAKPLPPILSYESAAFAASHSVFVPARH